MANRRRHLYSSDSTFSGFALQFIPYFQSLEQQKILLISSATLASMFGLFSIFGNVFGGVLFDKLGLSKSFILAGILVVFSRFMFIICR